MSSRTIYHRSVVPMRPVRKVLPSFSCSAYGGSLFVKPVVIRSTDSDDCGFSTATESCVVEPEDGCVRLRVLDFFTFFSYTGSDGQQTISSAQFVADTNPL